MVGLGTGWLLVLMLLLSVVSLAVMLERAWLYWSLRDDIDGLMRDLGRLLRGGDLEGARRRLEASRSAEAASPRGSRCRKNENAAKTLR